MIDEELFADFVEHRKQIKKPMTQIAQKRMRMRLEKYEMQGQDISALIEKAICNGWMDVWPEEKPPRPAAHRIVIDPIDQPKSSPEAARAAVLASLRVLGGGK